MDGQRLRSCLGLWISQHPASTHAKKGRNDLTGQAGAPLRRGPPEGAAGQERGASGGQRRRERALIVIARLSGWAALLVHFRRQACGGLTPPGPAPASLRGLPAWARAEAHPLPARAASSVG